MINSIRSKLTYANVMASIAVFLLLGGGAYAATQLPKNSIGTKQLKNGSITLNKLSNSARTALKGKTGPTGPQGTQGPQGPQGPAGTALAYALVQENGKVDSAGSKGVVEADVSLDNTGVYCFNHIPAGTKSIVATPNGEFTIYTNTDRTTSVSFIPTNPTPSWSGCASGSDPVRVTTFDLSANALTNTAFMIWFEG
jgi:hypothetical protein